MYHLQGMATSPCPVPLEKGASKYPSPSQNSCANSHTGHSSLGTGLSRIGGGGGLGSAQLPPLASAHPLQATLTSRLRTGDQLGVCRGSSLLGARWACTRASPIKSWPQQYGIEVRLLGLLLPGSLFLFLSEDALYLLFSSHGIQSQIDRFIEDPYVTAYRSCASYFKILYYPVPNFLTVSHLNLLSLKQCNFLYHILIPSRYLVILSLCALIKG